MSATEEIRGMERIEAYSIVGVASAIYGIAYVGIFFATIFAAPMATSYPLTGRSPLLSGVFIVGTGISLVFGLIGLVLLVTGFGIMSGVESGMKTPYKLLLIGIAGFVVLLAGLIGIFAAVLGTVTGTVGPAAGAPAGMVALLIVDVIALVASSVLVIIGVIGIILGLWRIGSRYDDTLIKVAAILMIIPGLSVVAPFLLLFGSREVLARLRSAPPPPAPLATIK